MTDELGGWIRKLGVRQGRPSPGPLRLLILTHDNPDPDSIAAALCLERIARNAGVEATIAYGGIIGRAENRAMVRELAIDLVPIETLDQRAFDRIALVDTQPGTGNNSLIAGLAPDVVIDHHPLREESRAAWWCDVRDAFGASTTIVYRYLQALGIELDERLATACFYALKSETRDLSREAGPHEREAYSQLLPKANRDKLFAIVHPKVGREHYAAVDRALRAAEVRGELLTANLGTLDFPDLVAEVADLLLPYEAAHWVLCAGEHQGSVYLSIRTDLPSARAGELIRRVIAGEGAGGGHGMIAGGRLRKRVASPAELLAVWEDLVRRLAAELHITAAPSPLLQSTV